MYSIRDRNYVDYVIDGRVSDRIKIKTCNPKQQRRKTGLITLSREKSSRWIIEITSSWFIRAKKKKKVFEKGLRGQINRTNALWKYLFCRLPANWFTHVVWLMTSTRHGISIWALSPSLVPPVWRCKWVQSKPWSWGHMTKIISSCSNPGLQFGVVQKNKPRTLIDVFDKLSVSTRPPLHGPQSVYKDCRCIRIESSSHLVTAIWIIWLTRVAISLRETNEFENRCGL